MNKGSVVWILCSLYCFGMLFYSYVFENYPRGEYVTWGLLMYLLALVHEMKEKLE